MTGKPEEEISWARAERQRLFKITAKLTEEDLTWQLPNGWSVATKLSHLIGASPLTGATG
jgi:hypothetical protein